MNASAPVDEELRKNTAKATTSIAPAPISNFFCRRHRENKILPRTTYLTRLRLLRVATRLHVLLNTKLHNLILIVSSRNFRYLPISTHKCLRVPFLVMLSLFMVLWRNAFFLVSFAKIPSYHERNAVFFLRTSVWRREREEEQRVTSFPNFTLLPV